MKKVKLFLLILGIKTICFGEIPAILENDSIPLEKKHNQLIIKTSPPNIIMGDYITNSFSASLSFEKAIKKTHSIHLGARYIYTDKSDDIFDKRWLVLNVAQVNGFGIDKELRKYLGKDKMEMSGAYLSTNVKSVFTKAKWGWYTVNRFSAGGFINIGWQEIFDSGVVFDIAVGGGLRYVISNSNTGSGFSNQDQHYMDGGKKPYHTGSAFFLFLNVNFNLGYNFNKTK